MVENCWLKLHTRTYTIYVSEPLLEYRWAGSQFLPKPQVDGKIVGGLPAKITDYPYQVGQHSNINLQMFY